MLEPNRRPAGSDLAAGGFAVPDTLRRRFDFGAAAVRRSLEGSLERLGLDRVHLVYVHDPDDHVDEALAGAVPELIRMREEGLVTAVGVGMNQWQAPLRMVRETGIDLVMLACRWTLLDRSGQPLLDECAARGVAVVAAAPFNSGLLARAWPPDGAYFDYVRPRWRCWPGRGPWPRSASGTACRCRTRRCSSRCGTRRWCPWSAGWPAASRLPRPWPASLPWSRTTRGRSLMPADGLLDIDLAYGRQGLRISLPADRTTVVAPAYHPAAPDVPAALREALRRPVAGPPLRAVVRPGQRVAVSVCDLTRPQPREAMLRALLDELDGIAGPDDLTVLIATGTHRGNTPGELAEMLGADLAARLRVIDHDARDESMLTWCGEHGDGVRSG